MENAMFHSQGIDEIAGTFSARGLSFNESARWVVNMSLLEKECPVCGKTFECHAGEYVYKRSVKSKTLYFCGYSHMREFDKKNKHEDGRKHRKKRANKTE